MRTIVLIIAVLFAVQAIADLRAAVSLAPGLIVGLIVVGVIALGRKGSSRDTSAAARKRRKQIDELFF